VDSYRQVTEMAFAAGNCLQVHDLADDAAEEGEIAGTVAIQTLAKGEQCEVSLSKDVMFVVPQSLYVDPTTVV
jgi:hypothetical protein